jgi:hypothetical protein
MEWFEIMSRAEAAFQRRLNKIGGYNSFYIDEIASSLCRAAKLVRSDTKHSQVCARGVEPGYSVIWDERTRSVIVHGYYEVAIAKI